MSNDDPRSRLHDDFVVALSTSPFSDETSSGWLGVPIEFFRELKQGRDFAVTQLYLCDLIRHARRLGYSGPILAEAFE